MSGLCGNISAATLGAAGFRADYNVRYAYVAGAMYKGISSEQMVIALGRAGLMCYFGTGGLVLSKVEAAIDSIRAALPPAAPFGMNLLCNMDHPEVEERTVEVFLSRRVACVEAAAFMRITPALVRFRLSGLSLDRNGDLRVSTRILAKVSRPEVAAAFMQPAPDDIVRQLLAQGLVSPESAELSARVPMAEDICVEADSGGHTDQGVAIVLLPTMLELRDEMMRRYGFEKCIRIGAAGGIGTPRAAAAAFVMGADFILTGSINQCTVEAGTSDAVKEILQEVRIQDTEYVPAGDMFEIGAKCQVVKRGCLFPARANKLYELYRRHSGLDEIEAAVRQQIQDKYFKRSFAEVWEETRAHYLRSFPQELPEIETNPKRMMAVIFRWYFIHTARLARHGLTGERVDFQIHCGPAMGSVNQWLKGTAFEPWHERRAAQLGETLMSEAAHFLGLRLSQFAEAS